MQQVSSRGLFIRERDQKKGKGEQGGETGLQGQEWQERERQKERNR